ncbi:uncharacterized protein LOC107041905 [Diachasma alloeum]|uniref:uncharacterized protein LOC107041905 n=1 Tax=Diachasma alloeum TaxID=454923 RepID=UPI0007383681|nr:uncharacterized protein LOC107041905 [Diachasma alloeum]
MSCSANPRDSHESNNLIRKMALSEAFSLLDESCKSEHSPSQANARDDAPEVQGPWNIIIVNQIPLKIDDEKFISIFSKYGRIRGTYMCHPRKRRTRKHERTARLTFESEADAWKVWEAAQEKLIKYDDQVLMITLAADDYSPIQNLPDFCLREIFRNIHSVKDKLLLEMVCQRWRDSGRCSWSNIREIGNERWDIRTWRMILSRVGGSLRNVTLKLYQHEHNFLQEVAERCARIEKLECRLIEVLSHPSNSNGFRAALERDLGAHRLRYIFQGLDDVYMQLGIFPPDLTEDHSLVNTLQTIPLTVALSNFQNLQILRLHGFRITDDKLIDGLINLEQLSLINCDIPEPVLSNILRNNKGLKYLTLGMDNLSDRSLTCVQQLSNLKVLVMESKRLTDAFFGETPRLKGLMCSSCHLITDEGIHNFFNSAVNIEKLCIVNCPITLESLEVAQEWTERRGKPLKLFVDEYLFYRYSKSDLQDTEGFQVIEFNREEVCGELDSGKWGLELLE